MATMATMMQLEIRDIAKCAGVDDYRTALAMIIGQDYQTCPMTDWGDRARQSFFGKLQEIAIKYGFSDYESVLIKIVGDDYNTMPLDQWGERAREAGYLMNDRAPIIDSIDLLFAQERLVVDR